MRATTRPRWAFDWKAAVIAVVMLAAPTAIVCASSPGNQTAATHACPPHPYPCGNEWPDGLEGPFELLEVQTAYLEVPKDWDESDGPQIALEGWIGIPDVDAPVPTVLVSTPYIGGGGAGTPADPKWWSDPPGETGVPPNGGDAYTPLGMAPGPLVKQGYAVAFFQVRGTGGSGGCLDWGGPDEERDQAAIVDFVAGEQWSNGRVGMMGGSYPGATQLEAAVHAPEALKAIIPMAPYVDLYKMHYGPNGAMWGGAPALLANSYANGAQPQIARPLEDEGSPYPFPMDRLCDAVVAAQLDPIAGGITGRRDAVFYAERDRRDRLHEVTAATLWIQGFQDTAHMWQSHDAWELLQNAPTRQVWGHWGHCYPADNDTVNPGICGTFNPEWASPTWEQSVVDWFDYWLKGIGAEHHGPHPIIPEHLRLGNVDFQTETGTWFAADSWPPEDGAAVYLDGTAPAAHPGSGERTFLSGPTGLSMGGHELRRQGLEGGTYAAFCDALYGQDLAAGLVYLTEPLAESLVLAGNPTADLVVSSSMPGGVVTLQIMDISPKFDCSDPSGEELVESLTAGAADLRFTNDRYLESAFPVDTPTHVTIDLYQFASEIPAGHRIAILVDSGEDPVLGDDRSSHLSQPYYPRITVHGQSAVAIPLLEGNLPLT